MSSRPSESPPQLDRRLERQARRLDRPGFRFLLLAAICLAPGVPLWVLTGGAARVIGIVLTALATMAVVVGVGLLAAGLVAHWAAHRRPFA